MTLAGVKTVAAFNRAADCVEVEQADREVTLIPMRNLGAKGGFEPDLSRKVTTSDQPARVGELVAAAFQMRASPMG